jgi:hypothetical protein
VPTAKEKYAARVAEVESLQRQLNERPGEAAVVAGLLLEAAGDVLRRAGTLGVKAAQVAGPLEAITDGALRGWAGGVSIEGLGAKLQRAASQAVEAAIPDSDEAGAACARFAVQDLQARDRFESALCALEAMPPSKQAARDLAKSLRDAVSKVDRQCRSTVVSLTALNAQRREEAALLDAAHRANAWWYSDRTGIEDDTLIPVLGGTTRGSIPPEFAGPNREVTRRRTRSITTDDLMKMDLGLATAGEKEMIRIAAESDPELKLALAAMAAGEEAIDALTEVSTSVPVSAPVERVQQTPQLVEEHPEFKVLVFRAKKNVTVVLQPGNADRFATAAVYRGDQPVASQPGEFGLHFNVGETSAPVRVVVRLVDGQSQTLELKL